MQYIFEKVNGRSADLYSQNGKEGKNTNAFVPLKGIENV